MATAAVITPAPIKRLLGSWPWFVDGLVEAVVWARDRARPASPYRLVIGDAEAIVLDPAGAPLGRLTGGDGPSRIEPPDLAQRLGGNALDVVMPPAWRFRRELDPVAVQSRPFLDAFVRHQIERITPWRADAVHHQVLQSPMPGDANRLAVSVVMVPKRLTERWLAPLDGLGLRAVRLTTGGGLDEAIALGGAGPRGAAALRRGVAWSVAALVVATALLSGWLEWRANLVQADIDDQDRVLAERKVVLARARMGSGSGDAATEQLRKLRDARPLAVAVIDALAAAVPDSAYLTSLTIEKDHVAVSGLSREPSALVPAIETSGRFANVAFAAPTTRIETGNADRFSLTMQALPTATALVGHAVLTGRAVLTDEAVPPGTPAMAAAP